MEQGHCPSPVPWVSQGVGEKGEVPTAAAIPLKPVVVLRYALWGERDHGPADHPLIPVALG
jgi:hypothetical protein